MSKINYEKAWKELESHFQNGKNDTLVKIAGQLVLNSILEEMEQIKGKCIQEENNSTKGILEGLEELLKHYPDFRFGQIINMMIEHDIRKNLYNIKDKEWLDSIDNQLLRVKLREKELNNNKDVL